uniref:Putative secreted protein n=1 Tax=Ixodes ricinus TaxID=34613 RepID=A0A6B0UEL2_IXORI
MSLTRGLSAAGLASSAESSATGKWYWNSEVALNEPLINRCDTSSHRQHFSLKRLRLCTLGQLIKLPFLERSPKYCSFYFVPQNCRSCHCRQGSAP